MMKIESVSKDYYSQISADRDINKVPSDSKDGTKIGYQYSGMSEEDRIANRVLDEHYAKVYQENLRHSDPKTHIYNKYYNASSSEFCGYMTEEQRNFAYRNELQMLKTNGKNTVGHPRYDYALRDYDGIYTGGKDTGYTRNVNKEKQYSRSVVNQQIQNLFTSNGISLSGGMDLKFTIDPYHFKLKVSGKAEEETLLQIETFLNEGDNAKNIWNHAWNSMHDKDNEIINSQASKTKAEQYSLWHEFYKTTGYDLRNAKYEDGTFKTEDGQDLVKLYRENAANSDGADMYTERLYKLAKNGWNTSNDLQITIGYDSSGLYDIGQENGYGLNQTSWMGKLSEHIFDMKV